MKTLTFASVAAATLLAAALCGSPARADVSFDFFYSNLSPHGSWLASAQYGRVWQPRVYGAGWNPYYDGRWAYTDVGWTWVSDYDWGTVPYHYGTWTLDPVLGWVWVPGYTWAPAWVEFRTGPDVIGWAPVPPGYSVGAYGVYSPAASSFIFVSTHDFAAQRIRPCVLPEARRAYEIQRTQLIPSLAVQSDMVVSRGPDVRVVERASGQHFRPSRVESVPRVAPFPSARRDLIAIAPDRRGHAIAASEPFSPRRPTPPTPQQSRLSREEQPPSPHRRNVVPQQPQRRESVPSAPPRILRAPAQHRESPTATPRQQAPAPHRYDETRHGSPPKQAPAPRPQAHGNNNPKPENGKRDHEGRQS